jgi:hypothetical protein
MIESEIAELITRRRKQLLVHSIIYYRLNDNIISDYKWSEWAKELCDLQTKYPEIAEKCYLHDGFRDFDGSTGFNLPLTEPWAISKAQQLLRLRSKMQESELG